MAYGCNFSKVVSILTKHMKLLPLQGALLIAMYTQGAALG